MSKSLPIIILGTFFLLALVVGILYFKLFSKPRGGVGEAPKTAQEPGEIILSGSDPNPEEVLRTSIINLVTVDEVTVEEVDLAGETRLRFNLTLAFNYQGSSYRLSVPVIGSIGMYESEKGESRDMGVLAVSSLALEKGDVVNLAFSYISEEAQSSKEEVVVFCEILNNDVCLKYIELGFGDKPINFDTYLSETLGQESSVWDYTVAFPNTIFVLNN